MSYSFRSRIARRLRSLFGPDRGEPSRQAVPAPAEPTDLRYVYRVVVDGERDENLLVRNEPARLDDRVPFRGQPAVVERIEETHERDASGNDVRERVEADPRNQIMRTLHCRLVSRDDTPGAAPPRPSEQSVR